MVWTTIVILSLLLAVSYLYTRSIIHPGVVTAGIWLMLLIIYNASNFDLYALSDSFYKAVLLWTCPFCIASLINQQTPSLVPDFIAGDANPNMLSILKPLILISLVAATVALVYRGRLFDPSNILYGIRLASVASLRGEEDAIPFPLWMKPFVEFANNAALPVAMYLVIIKRDRSKYSKILLTLLIVYFLLRTNKTVIAQIGMAFVCIMLIEQTISKKKAVIGLLVMAALMIGISYVRGLGIREGDFMVSEFLAQYLLAPLPAFDSVLDSYTFIEDFHGEYTFRPFIKFMQLFDSSIVGNSDPYNLKNWVYVPVPINVYTALFTFYEDFGYIGIACYGIILGLLAGMVFKHAEQGYLASKLVYACLFYTIAFQFFSDYFFQFFWTNMGFVFFAVLLVVKFKVKKDTEK